MSKRMISLLLSLVLFTSTVLGNCAFAENKTISAPVLDTITEEGVKAVMIADHNDDLLGIAEESNEWEQYIGDIETFAYGLIIHQLEYFFDVFPASIDLSDGNQVYGLAYTDYSDCYTNEDESACLFEAGFIPFNGELPVSQEEIDAGLYITNLDFTDEDTSFIWSYDSGSFRMHCVVYGQYLQYGIDDNGAFFYEATEYIPGTCDESLGSLYSYDEAKYLVDVDVGTYLKITGTSLFSQLDYEELEEEINRIIQTQDINFSSIDVVSCANFAQESIISYLLSLQEETFLGYSVAELVEAAKTLDPLECYRITANGLTTLKLEEGTPASALTKWLVGTGCVILTTVGIVGSVVFIECPPLSALAGAVSGAAIETFMQVVISNKALESVDWRKVVLGAAAGALSGFLGPYVAATSTGGSAYFVLDSAIDGFIGGIERAAETWLDSKDAISVIKSFGIGVGIGVVLSAGFKGIAAGVSKLSQKIGPVIQKLAEKCPTLVKKAKALKNAISHALGYAKEKADNTIFHSKYITKKIEDKQLKRLLAKGSVDLLDTSIDQLPASGIVDTNGNELSKATLKELVKNADEGAVIAQYRYNDEVIDIVKHNSMVGIVFDSTKYQTVTLSGGLTTDRYANYLEVAKILKVKWYDDPSLIPESIATVISGKGKPLKEALDAMSPQRLRNIIIADREWLIHENVDRISATLVPALIHKHVSHMGGVGLAKYLKSHIGMVFFDRLVSAVATDTVLVIH